MVAESIFEKVFGKREKPETPPAPKVEQGGAVGEIFGGQPEQPPARPSSPPPSPPAQVPSVPEVPPVRTEEAEVKSEPERVASSPPSPPAQFDLSEDKGMGKIALVIYGLKGNGKTYTAISLPGSVDVLSFDRKATMVKTQITKLFPDKRVRVFDCLRYMNWEEPEKMTESAEITYRYVNAILDEIVKSPPDWIVIDGSEIFQTICEYVMRYRNNILPFQGIANLNLWKERRMYIRQIHQRSVAIARKGIIYTTYVDKDEIVEEGDLVTKKDVPRWIDAILYETDVVVKIEPKWEGGTRRFYAYVESSKYPEFLRTGAVLDITNKGLSEVKV
jgi:hypothetical protein